MDSKNQTQKREIKFRVYNGVDMTDCVMVGKFGAFFVNPSNNGIDEKDSASLSPLNTKYHENTPVMQFTGLKDNTGKDIYEGDILKVLRKGLGIVEWYNYGFIVRLKGEIIWPELFFHVSGNYTIVGNIFENPEQKTGF